MNQKLEYIYNQIPVSVCPPDCGACCGILFPSLAELNNIKEWCSKHSVKYKDFNMQVGLNCSYLIEDKRCSIYPVRPFLCRLLGVCSTLPCPLNKCKTKKVLNESQGRALYGSIYLKGKEKPRTEKHREMIRAILGL